MHRDFPTLSCSDFISFDKGGKERTSLCPLTNSHTVGDGRHFFFVSSFRKKTKIPRPEKLFYEVYQILSLRIFNMIVLTQAKALSFSGTYYVIGFV